MKPFTRPDQVLTAARAIVATRWTQGAKSKVINGVPHHCAEGAVEALAHCAPKWLRDKALSYLEKAVPSGYTLLYYNDEETRVKKEIVELYNQAIALCKRPKKKRLKKK